MSALISAMGLHLPKFSKPLPLKDLDLIFIGLSGCI